MAQTRSLPPSLTLKEIPYTASVTIPVLEGTSNWNTWQLKFQHVTRSINPVYWEIFVGNIIAPSALQVTPQVAINAVAAQHKLSPNQLTKKAFEEYQTLNSAINRQIRLHNHYSLVSWRRFESEARAYLNFALDAHVCSEIQHISSPREAYLKLKSLYIPNPPDDISNAWAEWLGLRYRRTTPTSFVARFRLMLENLRAQGVKLSTAIEANQFKLAISQTPACGSFLANLHFDQQDEHCMEYIYFNFIHDQMHSEFCYSRQH